MEVKIFIRFSFFLKKIDKIISCYYRSQKQLHHYYVLYPTEIFIFNKFSFTIAVIHFLSECAFSNVWIGFFLLTFHKLKLLSVEPDTKNSGVTDFMQSIDCSCPE